MAALKNAVSLYQQLKKEWNRKPPNVEKCGNILSKLKIALLELSFLPTTDSKPNKRELIIARDILEIGVQWSVQKGDIESFQRYMAQLKPITLTTVILLCHTREFIICLELAKAAKCFYTMQDYSTLQRRIMLMLNPRKTKGNVPAESYNFFIDILLLTIRDEIAGCAEKAYDRIACNEAARILFFNKLQELNTYADKRGWKSVDNHFVFTKEVKKTVDDIPSHDLALQAIEYARELEMIV
ncbi:putative 26S proteasome non-ATPase regulatory subunit 8-like [Apostichopus japonicus]|uniref:Putative 26S proteasome non-ATPase regulatory subunit 8-like n=1 Tax=Stichopus japonicus TaxID=307972 RepID=A0A2G8KX64_STIJA|nr:putative 26S proteasome non-ATPase regulatory subunit 8-like [Apostichopus japonicus]